MKTLVVTTAVAVFSLISLAAYAQEFDVRKATENLARSVTEDYERFSKRQRAREDAEDAPDYSRSAVPANEPLTRPARSGGVTCITTGLGDGDSITTCR